MEFEAGTCQGRPTVAGFVYNDNGVWAENVRLLVESLDGQGHVIARGHAYVGGGVPPKGRAFFDARVPCATSGKLPGDRPKLRLAQPMRRH